MFPMPKTKRNKKFSFTGEWKPVTLDQPFTMEHSDDLPFGGLIEIEELTDYQVDKPKKAAKKNVKDDAPNQEKESKAPVKRPRNEEDTVVDFSKPIKKKKKKPAAVLVPQISAPEVPDEILAEDDCQEEVVDVSKWEQLQVADYILKALKELKFCNPTPIQELCLPFAMRSRKDIIGAAETGSGKTLAFGIPLVQNIMEDKAVEEEDAEKALRALIITPTRELAVQIKRHIEAISKYANVSTCLIVGGMFKEKQDRLLRRNPDILIATPGRLFEHIQNQTPYLQDLSSIRYLVIDEADRMVEKGHFKELTDILERLNQNERATAKRQTLVFSATLGSESVNPEDRGAKASEDPSVAAMDKFGNMSSLLGLKANAKVVDLTKKQGTVEGLTERRLPCTLKDKDYYFEYLLMTEATGRTIVFCNSLDCVRRLHGVFGYLLEESGRSLLLLHAGMHQKQRLKNLERFHANPKAVLLASDVAARGLDIPDVQFVVHYQVPRNPQLYVHRSGRTARAFKVGSSVLLVDPSDAAAYHKILRNLSRDKDFPVFDVDPKLLRFARERVDLARRIDVVEHALRKESSKDEWFAKAAEEAELILDMDDATKLDLHSGSKRSAKSKEAKMLKRQLKSMLVQPIKTKMAGFSPKYPALNFATRDFKR